MTEGEVPEVTVYCVFCRVECVALSIGSRAPLAFLNSAKGVPEMFP